MEFEEQRRRASAIMRAKGFSRHVMAPAYGLALRDFTLNQHGLPTWESLADPDAPRAS